MKCRILHTSSFHKYFNFNFSESYYFNLYFIYFALLRKQVIQFLQIKMFMFLCCFFAWEERGVLGVNPPVSPGDHMTILYTGNRV